MEREGVRFSKEGPISRSLGIGLTGFFSGMSDGIVTVILPIFLVTVGGGAATLGMIEGFSGAARRLVRPAVGAFSKWREGKRVMLLGATLAAMQGVLAFALSPLQVFSVRCFSVIGRGLRHPPPEAVRASRLYLAMERGGALLGPAIALASIGLLPARQILLFSFPPAFLAIASLTFLVRETPKEGADVVPSPAGPLPLPNAFYLFLTSAGIFGLGNFADTLLLLRSYELLTRDHGAARAASLVTLLYILRQILSGATAVLIGRGSGRISKKGLLNLGYFLLGLIYFGFIFVPPVKSFIGSASALFLLFLFLALAGVGQSLVDSMERELIVDLLPEPPRRSGDRILTLVRGIGDLVSSLVVGSLWSIISPTAGFLYAALITLLGGIFLFCTSDSALRSKPLDF